MVDFRIMDHTGDRSAKFATANKNEMRRAMERFSDLTNKGYRAFVPGENGAPGNLIESIDPKAKEIIFIPRLKGG